MLPETTVTEFAIKSTVDRLQYRDSVNPSDIMAMLESYVDGLGYSFDDKYNAMHHIADRLNVKVSA